MGGIFIDIIFLMVYTEVVFGGIPNKYLSRRKTKTNTLYIKSPSYAEGVS